MEPPRRSLSALLGRGLLVAALSLAAGGVARAGWELVREDGDHVRVRFRYAPGKPVRSVHLAGSWNGWSRTATPMRDDDGDGAFEAEVRVRRGRLLYKIVVDGSEWLADPENEDRSPDGLIKLSAGRKRHALGEVVGARAAHKAHPDPNRAAPARAPYEPRAGNPSVFDPASLCPAIHAPVPFPTPPDGRDAE
jgi:hypothetical protein